jgi:hypothetical protein
VETNGEHHLTHDNCSADVSDRDDEDARCSDRQAAALVKKYFQGQHVHAFTLPMQRQLDQLSSRRVIALDLRRRKMSC